MRVYSDTHSTHDSKLLSPKTLPSADIILHCGDFTNNGSLKEVLKFNEWGKKLLSINKQTNKFENNVISDINKRKFKHIICIAGNHECSFDINYFTQANNREYLQCPSNQNPKIYATNIKQIISKSLFWKYLEDSFIQLYGINIYGSPWQPNFCNWAFNLPRGEALKQKWDKIITCDVLLTHGPPYCHGDKVPFENSYVGCEQLLNACLKRIKPFYHIFGHIHDGYGVTKHSNCRTYFINASNVNEMYKPVNKPIMFHLKRKDKN